MQVHSHHMQDLHLVQVCFRLVQVCTRYFFLYRGSFRFRFALSTRAQGVPFLHTIGRTSNRCRFSVLVAMGRPLYPHDAIKLRFPTLIRAA
jgi:hypothetical protein